MLCCLMTTTSVRVIVKWSMSMSGVILLQLKKTQVGDKKQQLVSGCCSAGKNWNFFGTRKISSQLLSVK